MASSDRTLWEGSTVVEPNPTRDNSPVVRITIAARPQPYAFDPSATAVIAIDLQNDFGAEGGYVASFGVPLEGTRATIGPIARVLDAASAANIPIAYTKIEYKRDLSNVGGPEAPNRELLGVADVEWRGASGERNDVIDGSDPRLGGQRGRSQDTGCRARLARRGTRGR